jgi:hypothetical protein
MADLQFEDDLRAMFQAAPSAPDAAAFAMRVERGLDRIQWIRLAMVSTLGLVGVVIAWAMFGASLSDVSGLFSAMTRAASNTGAVDDASAWAAALLLLAFGGLMIRPVFSET